jgi:mono/diheme cytochrome c family protein
MSTTPPSSPHTRDPRPPRLGKPPFWMVGGLIVLTVGSWLPLVFFARARVSKTPDAPVLLMQDMFAQPKYREQQSSEIFADGRAARPRVDGVVPRGMLDEDDHFFRGFTQTMVDGKPVVKFDVDFPAQVTVDAKLLERGRERFGIYCAPCHGLDGSGKGAVHRRALELQVIQVPGASISWVAPANLADPVPVSRPVGHIFNTISNGIRNMPGYGGQIAVPDRWAIVSYVRALQLGQNAPADLVEPGIFRK